jgi:4-phosphopantoate--beta-alanine ligase
LVPDEVVELAAVTGADIEVNLFNRTDERMRAIVDHLREHGAEDVKGLTADARIPGLEHERAKVDADGIYDADVVLVPLEDGDRAEALGEMGKTELVVDLNPLSRSPQMAAVPIVDNVVRAIPNITEHARELRNIDEDTLEGIIYNFDRDATLEAAERAIRTGGDGPS